MIPEGLKELSQAGPLTSEEMLSLSLPERYIVALCHDLVDKVTEGLETYELVGGGGGGGGGSSGSNGGGGGGGDGGGGGSWRRRRMGHMW